MPLTGDDKRRISQAVKEGRIADARSLLQSSDDPQAATTLKKLDAKYPPQPAARPLISGSTPVYAAVVLTVVLVIAGIGIKMYMTAQAEAEAAGRRGGISARLENACFERFFLRYYRKLGSDVYSDICKEEAEYVNTVYGDVVEQCYDAWASDPKRFGQCLDDERVVWSGMSLYEAAENLAGVPDSAITSASRPKARFEEYCVRLFSNTHSDASQERLDEVCQAEAAYLVNEYPSEIEACNQKESIDQFVSCLGDKGVDFSTDFSDAFMNG